MDHRIEVNGITLHVVVEGPDDGPAVLLLHGFPDSADLWRHQIPVLVDAGFRVIAPDQRGFGRSDRPEGVDAYAIPLIVLDALAVLDALEVPTTSVVGHDWGAAIAWTLPVFAPDRVERVAALSVGHPSTFFTTGIEQLQKSWYMLFFRHEGVAEEWLRRDDWSGMRAWHGTSGDVASKLPGLSRPGALTAGLNWYRANITAEGFAGAAPLELPPITQPVLAVWSSADFALTEAQMTGSRAHVTGPWRYERLDGVGHWIPTDAPELLNPLLVEFLTS